MKISVIVPTLDEEKHIEQTLASVTRQPPPWEVIVVDGGSRDRTVERARSIARVVTGPRGRAAQMNQGSREAEGDALLFLHADTILPERAFEAVRVALDAPNTNSGIFRLAFDQSSPLLRFYSACTRIPTPLLCFGDRGLFVRRNVFLHLGGFPDVPIFEDLELVRRLYRRGGFRFLPEYVTTAARRFEQNGPLRQQLRNAYLWTRYLLGTDPGRLAHLYGYGHAPRS